jgi:hypothetical protein
MFRPCPVPVDSLSKLGWSSSAEASVQGFRYKDDTGRSLGQASVRDMMVNLECNPILLYHQQLQQLLQDSEGYAPHRREAIC